MLLKHIDEDEDEDEFDNENIVFLNEPGNGNNTDVYSKSESTASNAIRSMYDINNDGIDEDGDDADNFKFAPNNSDVEIATGNASNALRERKQKIKNVKIDYSNFVGLTGVKAYDDSLINDHFY